MEDNRDFFEEKCISCGGRVNVVHCREGRRKIGCTYEGDHFHRHCSTCPTSSRTYLPPEPSQVIQEGTAAEVTPTHFPSTTYVFKTIEKYSGDLYGKLIECFSIYSRIHFSFLQMREEEYFHKGGVESLVEECYKLKQKVGKFADELEKLYRGEGD